MLQMILLLTSPWITAQGLPGTLYPFMLIGLKMCLNADFHIFYANLNVNLIILQLVLCLVFSNTLALKLPLKNN